MPSPAYEPARCVVCGHANANVLAEHDDIRREVEELWEYHERRLRPETPPRFLFDRVAFSQYPPLRIVQCGRCGLLYRNPAERADELLATYAGDATAVDVLRALHDHQLPTARVQARRVRKALGRGGSGLEVGCYVGSFLAAARGEGFHIEGLDVNRGIAAFVRSLGFTVHDGTLASYSPGREFDVVAIWNTFDQLADPRSAVYAAYALLRPAGILALRFPNGAFYSAARSWMSRGRASRTAARAVLAQNNLLAFPYRWGFTIDALRTLLAVAGFTVTDTWGDSLVATGDQYTKRWARIEEAGVKALGAALTRRLPGRAPWIELLARKI